MPVLLAAYQFIMCGNNDPKYNNFFNSLQFCECYDYEVL
jgi:hypothetical protein